MYQQNAAAAPVVGGSSQNGGESSYNGQAAGDWASANWDDYFSGCDNSCTAFVSAALSEGSLPMPGAWSPNRCNIHADPWTETDALYEYLLSQGWTEQNVNLGDSTWFVSNSIPAGSVVFYPFNIQQESGLRFEHAAITTGEFVSYTIQYNIGSATYEHVPAVADQSNSFITGPHAMLNTSRVKTITILIPPQAYP